MTWILAILSTLILTPPQEYVNDKDTNTISMLEIQYLRQADLKKSKWCEYTDYFKKWDLFGEIFSCPEKEYWMQSFVLILDLKEKKRWRIRQKEIYIKKIG